MPRRIQVAVTGLGVSRSMLHWYRDSADTELAMRHDVDEARLKEVAANHPGVRALHGTAELVTIDTHRVGGLQERR